jgi:hypothetical protein
MNGTWRHKRRCGNSLGIELDGHKAGLWQDRATNESGKLRNLIAASCNIPDDAAVTELARIWRKFRQTACRLERKQAALRK